ncbi:uncharacterized protein [Palaemon carinicauda]|uniref:uncharacterized protein n=1 Tax=Palaemon carinicauda TaxID=392227 RepID=UPI0035B684B2
MATTNGAGEGGGPLGLCGLGATTVKILIGGLVTFALIIIVSLNAFWQAGCPKGGFQCSSGLCLPKTRWCNNKTDCENGEDELAEVCVIHQGFIDARGPRDFTYFELCHLCYCNASDTGDCLPPDITNKKLGMCKTTGDSKKDVSVDELVSPVDIHIPSHAHNEDLPAYEIPGTSATRPKDQESSGEASTSMHHSRPRRSYWETWFVPGTTGSSSYVSKSIVNGNVDDSPDSEAHSRLQMKFQPPVKSGELDGSSLVGDDGGQQAHDKVDIALIRSDKEKYGLFEPLTSGGLRYISDSYKDEIAELSTNTDFINEERLEYRMADKTGQNLLNGPLKDTKSGCSKCKNFKKPGSLAKEDPLENDQSDYYVDDVKNVHKVRREINDPVNTGKNSDATLRSMKPPSEAIAGSNLKEQQKERGAIEEESHGTLILAETDDVSRQSRDLVLTEDPLDRDDEPYLSLDNDNFNGSYFEDVSGKFAGCYCELKTQLKCILPNFHSIPTNIAGHLTWLGINASHIKNIDPWILSQYRSLEVLYIENNLLRYISDKVFSPLENLRFLYLSGNYIETIETNSFSGLNNVETICIDRNLLRQLDLSVFNHTLNLKQLDLSHNFLNFRDNQSFPNLSRLQKLNLNFNKIRRVSDLLLEKLPALEYLRLKNNEIEAVCHGAFNVLTRLKTLDLSENRLQSVNGLFKKLVSLRSLVLEELTLDDISEEQFANLKSLKVVHFSTFRYCSYVPRVPQPQCIPNHDGFSNTQDLVGWKALRVGVWVMALIIILGNVLVIFCRVLSRKDISRSNSNILFIKNLASADLLMGIYLIIMGVKDIEMKGTFLAHSLQWAESYSCTFAGILATVSSETSMFILTFMSLERYLCVSNSYQDPHTLSEKKASFCLFIIWFASFSLAIFPALRINSFYGTNTMCYPLYINEPFLLGWKYSAFLFLGLNSVSLMLIIWSYTRLFLTRRQCIACTTLGSGEFAFAVRFFFIVFTNCLCWLPIICVKAAALSLVEINGGVYAWLVILVLPINSAVNPILYTFSTSRFKKHFEKLSKAIHCLHNIRRRQSSDTDTLPNSSGPSYHTSHTTLQNQSMETTYPEHMNHVLPEEVNSDSPSLDIGLTGADGQCSTRPLINENSSKDVDGTAMTKSNGKSEIVPEQEISHRGLDLSSPQDPAYFNNGSPQQMLLSTESVPPQNPPSQNNRQQTEMALLQKGQNGSSMPKFSRPGIRSKVVKFAQDLTIRNQILHSVLSYGDNKSTSKKNSKQANFVNSPLTNCSQEDLEEVE